MGKIKITRLSSATLVETIVALVIILVLFAITATVLMQTTATSFSVKKLKAVQLIDRFADETEKDKSFFSDDKIEGLFTLQKRVEENDFKKKVLVVKFLVVDNNGKLVSYQNRIFRE